MKDKFIQATKTIAIIILLLSIAFIISLGVKALDNSKIDIAELNGKVFLSGDSYLKINENNVIIDRTSYDIKSIDNDIIVAHRDNETFILKIIDDSTIFCEQGRRYYHEKQD